MAFTLKRLFSGVPSISKFCTPDRYVSWEHHLSSLVVVVGFVVADAAGGFVEGGGGGGGV